MLEHSTVAIVGDADGRRIAYLTRTGPTIPPHRITAGATIRALLREALVRVAVKPAEPLEVAR